VLVDRHTGERRFVVRDRRRLERDAPAFDLSRVDGRAVLVLDGHFPAQALRAARRARQAGGVVVADFSRPRPECLRLLPWVDYPILPLEFVQAWEEPEPRRALRLLRERFGGTPVVTLGSQGALALLDGPLRRIPAERVRVRDSTGAGDAFHGAFAAGLCLELEPLAALRLATRQAARCCRAFGGLGHLLGQRTPH
jgi:sulfofructose kinase